MKYLYICLLFVMATLMTGCYDREILDFKEGESLDPVTGLTYTVSGSYVTFSWSLPASYPSDIIEPVSVYLTVFKDDTQISTETISDAPTSYTYSDYDSGSEYRFIFKVTADVNTDDLNKSNLRYSEGVVVVL